MYVEDLLIKIRQKLSVEPIWSLYFSTPISNQTDAFGGLLSSWHIDFVQNVSTYVEQGRALSTKQSEILLKLIDRLRHYIVQYGWASETEIQALLESPAYRQQLYTSTNVLREVRYLGNNLIGFRCKLNPAMSICIKALGDCKRTDWIYTEVRNKSIANISPRFDWLYKIWIIPVYRHNLKAIKDLINEYRFKMDVQMAEYLKLLRTSHDQTSNFAIDEENQVIFANVCDDVILAAWITEVAEGVVL